MAKSKTGKLPIDPTVHEPEVEEFEDPATTENGEDIPDGPPSEFAVSVRNLIDTQISILDPFQVRALELVEKYKSYDIQDAEDKEGYEQVRVGIGELRKIRTGTKADKIAAKAPLKAGMDEIESKAKFIIETVSPLEERLQARKDQIDAIREEIRVKRKKAEEERAFNRISELVKMGATSVDGRLVLDDVSVDLHLIREVDDDIYLEDIFPQFKNNYDQKQAAIIEARERKEAEQAELKRQQEEFLEQQRKFKEEQELFARKQAEQAEKERLAREKEEADKKEALRKRSADRIKVITDIGMIFSFQDDAYVYNSIRFPVSDIHNLADADFTTVVANAEPRIADLKAAKAEEDARSAKEAQDKAIKEAQDKAVKEAEEKRLAQEKLDAEKKETERKEAEEKAMKASELEKWAAFLKQLESLTVPAMRSGHYRAKASNARILIDQIKKL